MPSHSNGVNLIAAERQRQIEAEGYDAAHDDAHTSGELARAAMAYVALATGDVPSADAAWPWDVDEFRDGTRDVKALVKAGALVAAEIDRIERLR